MIGHKLSKRLKILEARRKEDTKQKRNEEREARKATQATPNVVPVSTETSKQLEAPSGESASPKTSEKKTEGGQEVYDCFFGGDQIR